jgi:SnoaL-like protein
MRDLIERYLACWNETDPAKRRDLIGRTWADDASYTDPLADVRGHEQIEAVIAAAQDQFPGLMFTLAGPVDSHHSQARFAWGLGPGGGEPVAAGSDVALAGPDGRLSAVYGFLDKVPS